MVHLATYFSICHRRIGYHGNHMTDKYFSDSLFSARKGYSFDLKVQFLFY